jgi:hypothetical protein
MIGKTYLARQAATLLRLAHTTRDRKQSASLAAKAADLMARLDETPEPEDISPRAPDVEPKMNGKGIDSAR